MTTTEPADGQTSTRVADFADGTATFPIARRAVDVELVQVLDNNGRPVDASFEAADREDYPGVADVTVTAKVGDGPQSIQVICAE